jgi:murein DD-endopeptidase MepM/ murein hydrolase activator NlpD
MKSLVLIIAICLAGLPSTVIANADLPVDGPITSTVGWRIDPFGSGKYSFHRGIDIAVAEGTPVRTTRAGKIVFSGRHGDYGNTIIIEHDGGIRTLYGHNKSLAVQAGQSVEAAEVIALSGSSGRSTGPHVHYEVLSRDQFDAGLATTPGKVHADSELQTRLRMDEQLDTIMNSFLHNVRSSLPPGDPRSSGG